jgi:serine/threonine-protein kinase
MGSTISPGAYDRLKAELVRGAEKRLGRYLLKREVGRGGMAVVYEAEDPELHRRVALKIIRNPALVDRFQREAKIAAQLQHPNIVAIHDVGAAEDAGLPVHYIAMDFVEGHTLAQILGEGKPPRDELLRMLEDVARAVAHAHSRGVVHRDLKPGNVLVDATGRVQLADFGLARADTMEALTQSNSVMGTPQYMAPEQVRADADAVGPATDVWALGVMLYEVVVGTVPFGELNPIHLFDQITNADPTPPSRRGAAVSRDLEIVCLKAMEKDPQRRYATAQEFADDLGRFRRGEPIEARPASVLYRLARKLAKRKALVITTASAAVAVAVLVAFLLAARGRAVEELGRRTETALAAALELRRAGRIEQMQRFAQQTEEACREAMERAPDWAEPHYRLGRMYRALMREEDALAEQEKALARDARHRGALYERIVLLTARYRRRVEQLRELVTRGENDDTLARDLRARIEADVRALEGVAAPGPELDAARGFLAWIAGDTARAREQLLAAQARSRDLEEVWQGLAILALDERRFADSVKLWTDGLAHDQGYVPHLEGRGFARLVWGLDESQHGRDAEAQYAAALQDYADALKRSPNPAQALTRRGLLYFLWSHHHTDRGVDPIPDCDRAIADFDAALAHDPKEARAWMWRGLTVTGRAVAQAVRGADAADALRVAVENLDRAVALSPDAAESWMWRGVAKGGWAFLLIAREKRDDAGTLMDAAIADLDEAVRRSPTGGDALHWRGLGWSTRALLDGMSGADPAASIAKSLADLDEALRRIPEKAEVWTKRGNVKVGQATLALGRGEDPRALCEAGIADFREALARNPRSPEAHLGMARAHFALANKARDVVAMFRTAVDHAGRALESNPVNPAALQFRAQAWEAWAGWKELRREPAKEELAAALADLEAALAINATLPLKARVDRLKARLR